MRSLFLLVCLVCGVLGGFAQDYPIQKYTPMQGLVQSQVVSFLKDSRGIVWAGTYSGLSRFNGETFTNYTAADGLLGSAVSEIVEDKQGYIWLVCGFAGFVRFDGQTFKQYPDTKKRSLSHLLITNNNEKVVWKEQTDSLFQIIDAGIRHYPLLNKPKNLQNLNYHTYLKKTGEFVFGFDQTLFSYKEGRWSQYLIGKKFGSFDATFDDALVVNSAVNNNTFSYMIWDGQALSPFLEITTTAPKVVKPFAHDYVFVHNDVLYFVPKNTTEINTIAKNPPAAPANSYINQPDDQTLWIATEKGLWRMTRRGFKQFSEEAVPYCWGVVEDRNKALYFANFQRSLQKFDGKNFQTIPDAAYLNAVNDFRKRTNGLQTPQADDWYFRPLRDAHNNLWFGTAFGVMKYDNKRWQLFAPIAERDHLAFCIAEDKVHNKIVAASTEKLYTIDIDKPNRVVVIKDTAKIFRGLVFCVVADKQGKYWFSGRGICQYDPDTKRFKYYTKDTENQPIKFMVGLHIDLQNRIWAFGDKGGLYLYNAQKDAFERQLKGHFDTAINVVEQIDDNHLVIGTVNGIYVLDLQRFMQKREANLKLFNYNNGYNGVEVGQLGAYRDSQGYVWFTSSTVLTRMNPKELDLTVRPLKTFVQKIGSQGVSFLAKGELYQVPDNQNSTTFTVESIGDDKPFRSQFSFRIKGFIDEWSNWQEQNLLMVNNVPNGTHTIEIRSRTGSLLDTESSITTLQFKVSAPFYKSPNFYQYASLIGLCLLLGMWLFWNKERRQTKKLVEEKEKNAQQENKVRFLQVQTIQAQMNPHFTFNVLGTLQHLILNNETQKASENLLKLSSLIRNYLEASLLGNDQTGSLFAHEIPLAKEIDLLKMYIEFEQLQYTNRFDYRLSIDGKLNSDNYRIPPLILQPFVENAIKHGLLYREAEQKGNLWINFVSLNEDVLVCTIEDDGVGRQKAAELQSQSLKKYKSRGTDLVKKRVEILNEMGYDISIQTNDRVQGGTVVTIQIGYQ